MSNKAEELFTKMAGKGAISKGAKDVWASAKRNWREFRGTGPQLPNTEAMPNDKAMSMAAKIGIGAGAVGAVGIAGAAIHKRNKK